MSRTTASMSLSTGAALSQCFWPSAAPCAAAPCRRPSPARPRASSFSTAWFARPTVSTTTCRSSSFCRAAPVARARVRSRPRATVGLRKPSNTSVWSFPTSAARGAATAQTGVRSRLWASARRRLAPMPHARRRTSSSATSPAPSCAILSTYASWALAASRGSRSAKATAAF